MAVALAGYPIKVTKWLIFAPFVFGIMALMSLLAIGLNHHTAPVEVRERVAIDETRLSDALTDLRSIEAVDEAAIVSTCNRTEFYCDVRSADPTPVIHWLQDYLSIDAEQLSSYLFHYADDDAVRHLMRVCSGLDSMILGEPQILGQIKTAYRGATDVGTIGQNLSPMFESAFSVAKQVRTDTDIGANPVSVAFAAVSVAKQVFADLTKRTALLIGAGETIQLAARHLSAQNIGRIIIANRTVQRAADLAAEVGGQAMALADIPDHLASADIIMSSTASQLPILGKGAVERAQKARRYEPSLIVDIAVPRDVEPQVAELENVFLYTVDDMQNVITDNQRSRELAAEQAEAIIQAQVDTFMRRRRVTDAKQTIREYRETVEQTKEFMLKKYQHQLKTGTPAEEVLEQFAHRLSNKLMHVPTARLRSAAEDGDLALIEAAAKLFDLNKKS